MDWLVAAIARARDAPSVRDSSVAFTASEAARPAGMIEPTA
jgi:hypothetical protein